MEKVLNVTSLVVGFVGGSLSYLLGGLDAMLKCLLILIVLDYITGLFKAYFTKSLSSEIGFKGIIKKVVLLIVVMCAFVVQTVIGKAVPLRDIVVVFFICNEGLSLLENASEFVPIPDALKEKLLQLRDKKGDK